MIEQHLWKQEEDKEGIIMKFENKVAIITGSTRGIGRATAAGRGGLAYTSAKHGLLGLTRQMSLDHGRTGVRINAVLPGPIATDMIARVLAIPQHPVTMKIGMSPAKRPGEPVEVAQAIAFLASDDASFIHGAALAVDGGYTIF
jgi:NAD(P)-dependent dehydrogenase (short-subunit alcohol dehydrogenase family)